MFCVVKCCLDARYAGLLDGVSSCLNVRSFAFSVGCVASHGCVLLCSAVLCFDLLCASPSHVVLCWRTALLFVALIWSVLCVYLDLFRVSSR